MGAWCMCGAPKLCGVYSCIYTCASHDARHACHLGASISACCRLAGPPAAILEVAGVRGKGSDSESLKTWKIQITFHKLGTGRQLCVGKGSSLSPHLEVSIVGSAAALVIDRPGGRGPVHHASPAQRQAPPPPPPSPPPRHQHHQQQQQQHHHHRQPHDGWTAKHVHICICDPRWPILLLSQRRTMDRLASTRSIEPA